MDALAVLAGSWGVLMGISPLLQIRRIVQRGSSADVSIGYLTVLIVGFALWAAYGASIANVALVISNTVALVVGLATIAIARRYRHAAGAAPAGRQAAPSGSGTSEGRAAD
jgi:MtN3 and saliva related transmembrane protein